MGVSSILNGLAPEFRERVMHLLEVCREQEVLIKPYQGFRSAEQQARLWAQSRSRSEVSSAAARLRGEGAAKLAVMLERATGAAGPRVTNALPGQSWHQFGRALDCYIESPATSRALWRERRADGDEFGAAAKLYDRFGRLSESLGLTWGGRWALGDYGHVQLDRENSPLGHYGSWAGLEAALATKARAA
jgi:hypothetical protein